MFKEIFVQILQDKGITAYRLSKETGIPDSLISNYKNGKKAPSSENLVKIADYLNCSVDFLLGRSKTELEETEDEHRLIKAYRQLTDEGKRSVLHQAENFAKDPFYQKYTDIPKEA